MTALKQPTKPIDGQRPGTSGLRKKTAVFSQPGYLENYVQAIFNAIGPMAGKSLVIGGDGRYFNREAIGTILKMASANGVATCYVGQHGILSTPAASHLIRKTQTDGGLILSASHNPGGPKADFGLKYNSPNGGPAPESVTDLIFAQTQCLDHYLISDALMPAALVRLETLGRFDLDAMTVEVVDAIADYADLQESLFDFPAIRALFAGGFTLCFDAMHAVTGPYAREIFERRLGARAGSVINGVPSETFGDGHPDPNPVWATQLMAAMTSDTPPDFGAASDGDGDRNMIVGPHCFVSPSDSLAVLAANAARVPHYSAGLAGVARSMPTSRAVDRVAASLGIACFETPTGWKFFGNLLDEGKITLCGEESAGTGADHVREKDGIWAVLLWLNILAATQRSVPDLMADHWATFGRNYYSRHDYEGVDLNAANALMDGLRAKLPTLAGTILCGLEIEGADEFTYIDPVDASVSKNQGMRVDFAGGGRVVFRLSGTGTSGATLRVYLEQLETRPERLHDEAQGALKALIQAAGLLCDRERHLGPIGPSVVT